VAKGGTPGAPKKGGSGGLVTPYDTRPMLWWEADDYPDFTYSGGNVASWRTKYATDPAGMQTVLSVGFGTGGNIARYFVGGATRPAYSLNLAASNLGQSFYISNTGTVRDTGNWTAAAIFYPTGFVAANNGRLVALGQQDHYTTRGAAVILNNSAGSTSSITVVQNGTARSGASSTISTNQWCIVTATCAGGTTWIVRQNGVSATFVTAASNTIMQTFECGTRHNSTATDACFQGYIGAWGVWDRTLGTADLQMIEGSLAWSFGVQNTVALPASHPYKSRPPLRMSGGFIFDPTQSAALYAAGGGAGAAATGGVGTRRLMIRTFRGR
jgi:hypothetical protein